MIGNTYNFEKNVKAYLFFPKGGTCKRSISMKMWKDGFEPKLENQKKKRPSNSPFSDESDSLLSPPCADSCGFVHFESLIKILQHFLSRTLEDRLHSWICLKQILHDISH